MHRDTLNGSRIPPLGWWLPLLNLVVAGITCAVLLVTAPTLDDGILACVRVTPRPAALFFILAMAISPLHCLWPQRWTAWLLQSRRYLGVSFAVWHLVHLAGLVAMATPDPAAFWADMGAVTVIVGGLCFAFIIAMTVTSFDPAARAIGPRAWAILHTVGVYFIWFIFMRTYVSRVSTRDTWFDPVLVTLLGAALALRITARVRARMGRRRVSPAGATAN